MFDFGQPQAPLPSDLMTLGEKMRSEVTQYKEQKHKDEVGQLIRDNPQCVKEFTKVLGALHNLNPSEVRFRLIPDIISGTVTVLSIVTGQKDTLNLYEFIYEQGRSTYSLISHDLYQFLIQNASEIQEYFDLSSITSETTIYFENQHKGWLLQADNIIIDI